MNLEKSLQREKEITREINKGNTEHLLELLGIAKNLCDMYEPCGRCGFISRHKETGICKMCPK